VGVPPVTNEAEDDDPELSACSVLGTGRGRKAAQGAAEQQGLKKQRCCQAAAQHEVGGRVKGLVHAGSDDHAEDAHPEDRVAQYPDLILALLRALLRQPAANCCLRLALEADDEEQEGTDGGKYQRGFRWRAAVLKGMRKAPLFAPSDGLVGGTGLIRHRVVRTRNK